MSCNFSVHKLDNGYSQMLQFSWESACLDGPTFLMKIIRFLAKPNPAMMNLNFTYFMHNKLKNCGCKCLFSKSFYCKKYPLV